MDHPQLVDIDLVSSRQNHVVGSHLPAVRDGHVDLPADRLHLHDRLAFVPGRLADHPIPQPVGGRGAVIIANGRVFAMLSEAVEEIGRIL